MAFALVVETVLIGVTVGKRLLWTVQGWYRMR